MGKENVQAIKGIICFLGWFFIAQYNDVILSLIGINLSDFNVYINIGLSIIFNVLPILIVYLLFKKDIKKMFNDFKKNNIKYFNKYFKYWFLVLICMYISNFIVILINNGETPNNQDLIVEMFGRFPVYTFVLSVIVAPLIEELIFRFSFKKIFTNKYFYILTSGVVFGLFHVVGSYTSLSDFLYVIPYSVPGIIFAYVYYESKNIFMPIWLHFVHNGSVMMLQILFLLFEIKLP